MNVAFSAAGGDESVGVVEGLGGLKTIADIHLSDGGQDGTGEGIQRGADDDANVDRQHFERSADCCASTYAIFRLTLLFVSAHQKTAHKALPHGWAQCGCHHHIKLA